MPKEISQQSFLDVAEFGCVFPLYQEEDRSSNKDARRQVIVSKSYMLQKLEIFKFCKAFLISDLGWLHISYERM